MTHYRPNQARASAVKIPIQELWTDAIDMIGQQLVADFGKLNDLRANDSDQVRRKERQNFLFENTALLALKHRHSSQKHTAVIAPKYCLSLRRCRNTAFLI